MSRPCILLGMKQNKTLILTADSVDEFCSLYIFQDTDANFHVSGGTCVTI